MIPRQIFQTYPTRELPPVLASNVAALRERNPGWTHQLFDDAAVEAYIGRAYGRSMLATYRRIDPSYGANRADLFRYLLMYEQGGVYLDIKSVATRPLDEVLRPSDQYLLARWDQRRGSAFIGWGRHYALRHLEGGEFQQWHIVAAPGHPFLAAVIRRVLRQIDRYHPVLHGCGKNAGLAVTGPVPYTLAIDPLRHRYPHRVVDARADIGFEYSLLGASQTAHQSLFPSHYSKAHRPVVALGAVRRAASPALLLLQCGWRAGRSLLGRGGEGPR